MKVAYWQYVYTLIIFSIIAGLKFAFDAFGPVLIFLTIAVLLCSWFFYIGPAIMSASFASILTVYLFNHYLHNPAIQGMAQDFRILIAATSYFGLVFVTNRIKNQSNKYRIWRESQKQILSSIEQLEDCASATFDDDLKISAWSKGAEKILQYSPEEAIGFTWHRIFTGEDIRAGVPEQIVTTAKERGVWTGSLWKVRRNGSRLWGMLIVVRLKVGFMYILLDTTEQKQNQESLERWRHIFQHGGWAVVVTDAKTNVITHANSSFAEMHGYSSPEELEHKSINLVFAPEFISDVPKHLQASMGVGNYKCDTVHIKKNGTRFPVHTHMSLFKDESGNPIYRVSVCQDITGQRRIERQLRHTTEELRRNSEQKDTFLAMMAHELRNPLQPIKTTLHLYRQTGVSDSKMMDLIERNIDQIQRHVDDLMDIARINTGKIQLQKSVIDAREIIHLAIEQVYPSIKTKRHKFYNTPSENPAYVYIDPTRFQQIICNLLNNAVKFTNEDGKIHITTKVDNDQVVIEIKDTGIGIPDESLPKIFDLYAQAELSSKSQGGLGLGLALVKNLVELHDGKIDVVSEVGKGSTFTIRIPLSEEKFFTPEEDLSHHDPCEDHINEGRKILIVDDNVDAAASLQMMFGMDGCSVKVAYDGEEALVLFDSFRPDTILLDIGLPKIDGFEVARRIRKVDRRVVIIAVTGYGLPADKQRCEDVGFDAHVVKPVEPCRFKQLVNTTFEARRQRSEPNAYQNIK